MVANTLPIINYFLFFPLMTLTLNNLELTFKVRKRYMNMSWTVSTTKENVLF